MPNYNQAPMLKFDIPKEKGNNYYELPQKLMDKVFAELGNSSAQLRVMIVLIGTKPGFSISEQWILDRTGLTSTSYSRARTALIEKGWISLIPSKEIRVNFKTILSENSSNMKAGQSKNSSNMVLAQQANSSNTTAGLKNSSNMVLEDSSNMVLEDSSNMVLGIIDKEQINNKQATASQKSFEDFLFQKKEKGSLTEPIPISASELYEYNITAQDFVNLSNGLLKYQDKYFKPVKENFNF